MMRRAQADRAFFSRKRAAEYVGRKGKKPLSIKEITKRLNRENVHGPQGPVWYPETIREMLTCEAYIGKFHFGGIVIDLSEIRLITRKTFAQAQERVERNKALSQRNRKSEYLLSGYITCVCGHTMRGHTLTRANAIYKYDMCGVNQVRHFAQSVDVPRRRYAPMKSMAWFGTSLDSYSTMTR